MACLFPFQSFKNSYQSPMPGKRRHVFSCISSASESESILMILQVVFLTTHEADDRQDYRLRKKINRYDCYSHMLPPYSFCPLWPIFQIMKMIVQRMNPITYCVTISCNTHILETSFTQSPARPHAASSMPVHPEGQYAVQCRGSAIQRSSGTCSYPR